MNKVRKNGKIISVRRSKPIILVYKSYFENEMKVKKCLKNGNK